jgi:hypothetical protein
MILSILIFSFKRSLIELNLSWVQLSWDRGKYNI